MHQSAVTPTRPCSELYLVHPVNHIYFLFLERDS